MVTVAREQCLHALHRSVRCDACVVACPRGAFSLNSTGPVLDPANCDGCGRCLPACREGAVKADGFDVELRRAPSGEWLAFAACAQSGVGNGSLPCLHSLDWSKLQAAHARGVRRWLVANAPCGSCRLGPRGPDDSLNARLDALAALSVSRGEGAVVVEGLSGEAWRARWRAASPEPSRRALLRRLLPSVGAAQVPPAGALTLFAVAVEAARCSGCLACAAVCPHGAITVERGAADEPRALTLESGACTGCGLCVDACDDEALEVLHVARQPLDRLAFSPVACSGCRDVHHRPAASQVPCRRRPPAPRILVLEDSG